MTWWGLAIWAGGAGLVGLLGACSWQNLCQNQSETSGSSVVVWTNDVSRKPLNQSKKAVRDGL